MEENSKKEEIKEKEDKQIESNTNNSENENNQNKKIKEPGFFKKVWYSITKIERYPEMAAQGLGKAFSYICKVVAILAIILCLGSIYQAYQILQEGIAYLQNEFPEFSYSDGILNVNSENPIIISPEDSYVGKAIIDTKTEDEQTINQYISQIEENGDGIVVLNNRVVIKNSAVSGTISYEYDQVFNQIGLTEFEKQDIINYINSSQMINLTTLIAKIRMRFVAVFNMAVYSLTLSTILNMIYIAINIFVPFSMEYFQVMYVTVAAIYLVAAIFLLKSEYIKRQMELMKLAETEQLVRKELEQKEEEEKEKEQREKEKQERKEKDRKDEKKDEKQDGKRGEEPQGSGA